MKRYRCKIIQRERERDDLLNEKLTSGCGVAGDEVSTDLEEVTAN